MLLEAGGSLCPGLCVIKADGDPSIGVPGASRMAKAAQQGCSVAEMRATGGEVYHL